jgi:hypothetical protein
VSEVMLERGGVATTLAQRGINKAVGFLTSLSLCEHVAKSKEWSVDSMFYLILLFNFFATSLEKIWPEAGRHEAAPNAC